jgi:threonine dehydrogenase-like Zn-dependent dehydrogenase
MKAGRRPDRSFMIGHEFCAEIVAYGPETDRRLPLGSRVVSIPLLDTERATETIGLSEVVPGGFSERILLDERRMLPVPAHVSTEHAALVEPLAVGLRAVAAAELGPDDVALVVGCGPVGCAIIVALRRAGVPVVASDPSDHRREAARRLGADVVVDPAEESPVDAWRRLGARDLPYSPVLPPATQRSNAVLFECVGMPGMLQTVVDMALGHTRIVCVGACHVPDTLIPSEAIGKELTVRFAFAYRPEEFAEALDMVAEQRIDLEPFLTGVVAVTDIADAFEELRHPDKHVKLLVRP